MTATSPKAFFLSAGLHGSVVALLILFSFAAGRMDKEEPKVFELVAGEGDNYGAKEAPALGQEGAVKLTVPAPPPEPAPPAPAPAPEPKVEPAPIPPPPKDVVKPAPKEETVPNFAKQMKSEVRKAETKAKREIAKAKAAEDKRIAEEKKKMSKAEFDAKNKVASATPQKNGPTKFTKVDEGIAKGVLGGSSANKVGGQGGKALRTDNDDVMAAFFGIFKDRVRKNFEAPPGLSETLKAEIQVISHSDGSFSGAEVTKSSGSKEFDDAVLSAVRRVKMAARPDKKTDTIKFTFAMADREDR